MKYNQIQWSNISIPCLIKFVLRNLWMVAASAVILAMSASLYLNWVHVPQYQASMTYAVAARQTSYSSSGSVTATREISAVLTQMLETKMVRNEICQFSEELSDFSGSISGKQVGESNLIVVTARSDSPEKAFLSICAIRELFPTIVGYVSSDVVVQVIRNPAVSSTPVNPVNSDRTMLLAALAGAGLMAAFLCWYRAAQETIQTRTGARNLLDAHIVATVNRAAGNLSRRSVFRRRRRLLQVFSPTADFVYTEQINTICAQMEHEAATNGRKIYLITGVGENEGKTTISGNIAAALAMMGKTVAIVDCDLRNPSLARFFDSKYRSDVPLNKLLSEPLNGENLLRCIARHEQMDLYMLFSNSPDKRCTELLSGQTMLQLLRQLRVFDFVILDTPPMGYFADTETLMDSVDASMLVVRQDQTPAADINDACDLLRSAKSHFMGVVLNNMTVSSIRRSRYGYGYGYGYGYRQSKTHRRDNAHQDD